MNRIERGTLLDVTTASGEQVRMRALGPPRRGRDFPVVWVCTETEFIRAEALGDEADGLPWPLDAVAVADDLIDLATFDAMYAPRQQED